MVDAAVLLTFAFGCVFVLRVVLVLLDAAVDFFVDVDFLRADVDFAVLLVAVFFFVVVAFFVAIFSAPEK